jgi:6-phosphogluconolactonase
VAVRIFDNRETLSRAAADYISQIAEASVAERGWFHLALSGGGTPRRTYELLAGPPHAERVAWAKLHVYWSDERCVPPGDPESNYRMAREALLERMPIPAEQIHRLPGDAEDPDAAARDYEALLPANLDLVMLGVGPEGHTASLFPGSPALREKQRRVVAVRVSPPPVVGEGRVGGTPPCRLTFTPVTIEAARNLLVLVAGEDKADAVARALQGRGAIEETPAQIARRGLWLLDRAAASRMHL